jgi:Domain of unknown function (DUF4129)
VPVPVAGRLRNKRSHLVRGAVVVLLAALAVVGVRARGHVHLGSGRRPLPGGYALPTAVSALVLLIGVAALGAFLLGAWSASRRGPAPKRKPERVARKSGLGRGTVLIAAVLGAVVVAGVLALISQRAAGPQAARPSPSPSAARSLEPTSGGGHGGHLAVLPGLIIAALLLIVVVALLIRARRPRGAASAGVPPFRAEQAAAPAPASAAEPQVLEAHDAREAVIAHYAAMERELVGARLPRAPSETPEDLLGRARAEGFDISAARILAALYDAARFSTRPVPAEDGELARRSLAEVRRQWRQPKDHA